MIKVAVSGAAGRMGRRVIALSHEHPKLKVVAALDAPENPLIGKDAGELAGIGHIGVTVTDDYKAAISSCDVVVDFSSPEATVRNVGEAAGKGKAIVIGTTGLSDKQKGIVNEAAAKIPCMMAPNMSLGVNLLFSLVRTVAESLGNNYDVEIIEAHHNQKKDAPSGTAAKLAEIVSASLKRDLDEVGIYGRYGMVGARNPKEIGIMSVRAGDIVGEHTVMFCANGERIELTHRAHSRDAFARGAVQAAVWIVKKPAGRLYEMRDVLGL
ncbi:MAG: 4-hydroxy-tetrahydrodipicolinate reductase [Deltaproteobacteria bacterium]|nr:4-hydroxy-tetrahydrodipicolinate reductase [Deltaproteobacteria bacterium]